jgi:hypothetical protein
MTDPQNQWYGKREVAQWYTSGNLNAWMEGINADTIVFHWQLFRDIPGYGIKSMNIGGHASSEDAAKDAAYAKLVEYADKHGSE